MPFGVVELGSFIPERVITNADVGTWIGMSEDWIVERTGIVERRYAPAGTATSDLGVHAARQVLLARPGAWQRLEAIILATSTPDVPQPATAAVLQHKLGIESVPSFDVNSSCCGFVSALAVAEGLLSVRHKQGDCVLVVGAEMFSVVMNRRDRRTVSLFGDGAGAVLVGEVPEGYGLLATRLLTDGSQHHNVGIDAGGTRKPLDVQMIRRGEHLVRMDGRAVKRWVVPNLCKVIEQALSDSNLEVGDIDRFILHQANGRLIETIAKQLAIGLERIPTTVRRYGNTGTASVPVTLHQSHLDRPLERGERLLLAAAGGGLSAGAAALIWY
jgi:3-oxoacyl-[acyl-carrier-protein] synthase-3